MSSKSRSAWARACRRRPQCPGERNPLHCILPPHILDRLANHDDEEVRTSALATLNATATLSNRRVALNERGASWIESFAGVGWGALATAGLSHKNRTIFTANHRQKLPGQVVRREGDPPAPGADGDAVNEAYDYMGATYDFYWEEFDRDSVDDAGMALNGTVHFSNNYDNAYWDGQRMVYGDGDNKQFTRFTKSVDVIGHEMTHGVTQHEAGLIYWGQPGALNESISDVFGSMVRQHYFNQTVDTADWLIGKELLTNRVHGVALRSMSAPGTAYDDPVLGKDPQPATMGGYVHTLDDNAGVHINSGIPNKAFHDAAKAIGGYSWDGAGAIWYDTLLSPQLRRNATFSAFATLTVLSAMRLFPGANSPEVRAVRNAWTGVQVPVSA